MHSVRRRRAIGGIAVVAASLAALVSTTLTPDASAEGAGSPAGSTRLAAGSIAAGYVNSCVVLDSGAVRCWGAADQGVLGLGTGAGVNGSLDVGDDELPSSTSAVALGAGRTARSISMRYE